MASSSNSGIKYDIFLSFRGVDTRKKFTDHLYEALKNEGFITFRDDDEIDRGEDIKSTLQEAICNSRMSIIVLSKNYTNSTACLFEIQTIIEHSSKEGSDHWILPVFYEVNPEEIEKQMKDVAKYLVCGEKKVTAKEVEGWSAAVKKVTSMAGMVSENQTDGYEAKFIIQIIGELGKKQAGCYPDLKENLRNLKRKADYLISKASDINSEIASKERRPWNRQKKEVEVWLEDVKSWKHDEQTLQQQAVGEMNASSRVKLGKDIIKKIQEASELQEMGKGFGGLLIDENPTGRLPVQTQKDFVESIEAKNIENIWEQLMSDKFMKIGVYGMGGIGKTTIMEHIHNKLLIKTDKLVFWVTVSKISDIAKLHSYIAKAMKLDLGADEDVTRRASQLHLALSHRKSYVLILDDVWETFQLHKAGIPEPTRCNECKLVLTTRSLEVCQKMSFEPVQVHLLTEEEAWNLFLTKAVKHDTKLAPGVEKIARQISKKCACLPLAIVTVAGSLWGLREMCEWRHALKELTNLTGDACDITKVLEQLQFSYNRLGDEVLQDCFLYCYLFPEDNGIDMEDLIEHWIVEGLISEEDSVEAQFDEGHAILKKLTRRCLLEIFFHSDLGERVRMNDLTRDMARKITQSSPRFLVHAGRKTLASIQFEDWSEDLDRVSFMESFIEELPDRPPVCPRLATLLLSETSWLSEIADCFFTNMPGLKVLDLSCSKIKLLPESISNLENLQAIILEYCSYLEYVPSLKRLNALKQFSLSHSMIEELPEGIEELVNLRKLDLGGNRRLGEIPSWKLSRLSKLQCLKILKGKGVSAEHLLCLRQLRVVEAKFQNLQQFTKYVNSQAFQGLEKYRFEVGDEQPMYLPPSRRGKQVTFGLGCRHDDLVLPAESGYLCLYKVNDPKCLSAIPCMKDARDLRECVVKDSMGLESIFSSSIFSEDGQIVLRTVETLTLSYLPKFRVLFDEIPPPHNIFFNLEIMQMFRCDAVKNIFPFQLLHNFPNLHILRVSSCADLEDIIVGKEEKSDCDHHQDNCNIITLPKLKTLILECLPRLRSIYDGVMVCPSLEVVCVEGCPMLSRLPFSLHRDSEQVTAPPALRHITAEKQWLESLEWDDPLSKTILQPYFMFFDDDPENSDTENSDTENDTENSGNDYSEDC